LLFLVAAAFDDGGGIDDVAQRLAHFAPLLVQDKAVGEDGLIGGLAVGSHAGEQAGLEPPPVLVRAFQVQIDRVVQRWVLLRHSRP